LPPFSWLGGAAVIGWLINHYGPSLGLKPQVAFMLAGAIAILVALVLSLFLKPKEKARESESNQIPGVNQSLSQSGIVNAPHFEFNPHIEVSPAFNQTQPKSLHQSLVGQNMPELSFECIRAALIDVEVDMSTFEINLSPNGHGLKCKAAVADFRRNTDDTNVDTISIRTIAELKGRKGESLSINEGRWLEHDDKKRRSTTVPLERLDTRRLAVVLGISNNKVYTHKARH
jgi:hypothetical protein